MKELRKFLKGLNVITHIFYLLDCINSFRKGWFTTFTNTIASAWVRIFILRKLNVK